MAINFEKAVNITAYQQRERFFEVKQVERWQ